jgi:AraC-like DNA-binding protein/quercetin dioxygenase-like cupin family protein
MIGGSGKTRRQPVATMRVSTPITVSVPDDGVLFAESAHAVGFRMSERTDAFHKLILVLDGRVAYREAGLPATTGIEAGAVMIVPAGVAHLISDERPSTLLLLCIGRAFLEAESELGRLWQTLARQSKRSLRLSRPARQRLEAMWRQALAEEAHSRIGAAVATRALAVQTLVLLARLPADGADASASERVSAVVREIEETFYDQWDLDKAAGRTGLSRRRFTDLFREASGKTFAEFLTGVRLSHATRLLEGGEHSVTGVIFSCGFNDVSHFYRLFRQRHGVAPGEWVRRKRR